MSAAGPEASTVSRRSGPRERTYNVIDTRQSYLQKLLKQALATMGYTKEAERATHFAYEMVALSHATARELGYPADDSGTAVRRGLRAEGARREGGRL